MTEPSTEPTSFYSHIAATPLAPGAFQSIRWTSGYQGETEYEYRGRRLRFRWAKVPWRFSWAPASYWNYADRRSFELQHNGNHGLLTCGAEPVDPETLAVFRREYHSGAETGFFCHVRKRWVRCKATTKQPSYTTWLRTTTRRIILGQAA